MLLREMLFDASGSMKPARMSAVLNAALGYVAEQTDGFVDFDAVPADGAPLQARQQHQTGITHMPGLLMRRDFIVESSRV